MEMSEKISDQEVMRLERAHLGSNKAYIINTVQ